VNREMARLAPVVLVIAVLAACAAQPASKEDLRKFAVVTSGETVSYTRAGSAPEVSLVEVDGKPISLPYGPVELAPGTHEVILKCDGVSKASSVTVSAGEIYQFNKTVTPGVKGCTGSLVRVH